MVLKFKLDSNFGHFEWCFISYISNVIPIDYFDGEKKRVRRITIDVKIRISNAHFRIQFPLRCSRETISENEIQ